MYNAKSYRNDKLSCFGRHFVRAPRSLAINFCRKENGEVVFKSLRRLEKTHVPRVCLENSGSFEVKATMPLDKAAVSKWCQSTRTRTLGPKTSTRGLRTSAIVEHPLLLRIPLERARRSRLFVRYWVFPDGVAGERQKTNFRPLALAVFAVRKYGQPTQLGYCGGGWNR